MPAAARTDEDAGGGCSRLARPTRPVSLRRALDDADDRGAGPAERLGLLAEDP